MQICFPSARSELLPSKLLQLLPSGAEFKLPPRNRHPVTLTVMQLHQKKPACTVTFYYVYITFN